MPLGAQRDQQNVYRVANATQWPEVPDEFVIYNQSYSPGAGFYYWDGAEYQRMVNTAEAISTFAVAAYGGMELAAPLVPLWDLDGTWQTLDFFNEQVIAAPRGITVSLANNSMTFAYPGVYVLSLTGSFEHDNAPSTGRTTGLRTWNFTDGVPGQGTLAIGVGRGSEVTALSVTSLTEITEGEVGKEIQLQMGGGDTIDVVQFLAASWSIWSVGEWRGGDLLIISQAEPQTLVTEGGDILTTEGGDPLITE
jgi:hypothetical protein